MLALKMLVFTIRFILMTLIKNEGIE